MASFGGQQENYSNNPAVESTSKRAESREGSAERKDINGHMQTHALRIAAPATRTATTMFVTNCSGGNEMPVTGATMHWFAQVGVGEDDSNLQASKDREEKLKYARDRQNEERQRKIEELRAQAEAAQRYREQKEEERRRRIEEIRVRDTEKRHQVEERKKAIIEAEKERREYILKKNQERESRIEVKKRDRNSIGFAFGSSTPRLLDVPADYGLVSPSTFWGQRRSTSISNVAGASLSRRSSERELADSGVKKRASSSTDRNDDHRRKSSSMYEVFNWGYSNDEPPKRFSLSIAGSEINIDGPPMASHVPSMNTQAITTSAHRQYTTTTTTTTAIHNNNNSSRKEDFVDTPNIMFRSVYRRKTDLMPTIPSPRDGHYGSRSSLSTTPRTPGRAYSMNRLDQLAQPIRRNGEHVRAIMERERRERELEMLDETASLGGGRRSANRGKRAGSAGGISSDGSASATGIMSRSMTHLAGGGAGQRDRGKYSLGGGISSSFRPLGNGQRDSSKSMTQISSHSCHSWSSTPNNNYNTPPNPQRHSNLGLQTAATKKYLQSSFASSASSKAIRRGQQHYATSTNPYCYFDPNSLLLMNSSSLLVNAGSRSGNVTPGGHLNNSRPGSAMSNSTTMSSSGYVNRRPTTAPRKPRPASIAGTGMSLEEINKLKKEQRPPMKTTAASPTSSTAQTTPKRTANPMSTSLIVTSSSSRLSSAEKKTPSKREPVAPKPASAPKALPSRTTSSERISRPGRETRTKDTSAAMTKSMIVTNTVTAAAEQNDTAVAKEPNVKEEEKTNAPAAATPAAAAVEPAQSKAEKEALNSVKTEEVAAPQEIVATQPQTVSAEAAQAQAVDPHTMEEKVDVGNEKEAFQQPQQKLPEQQASANSEKKSSRNGSKENSEVRELTPPAANAEGNDLMTASMIAKKITTEEEAKAALAERRRLAREEAERQAELERQRIEAERLAEIKRQEEEAERQRQFEEEATRLAEEQRRGEEERLRKAIEEAKAREEEEQRKRADEERQRIEREEAEKKAKEDAEKQRVEVAERLKREEKEREERRKRVEAIMSRTRKGGAAAGANTGNTPSSTPAKESNATAQASPPAPKDNEASSESVSNSSSSSNSTGSPGSNPPPTEQTPVMPGEVTLSNESQNTQATYEQSVLDKENSLINSFSSMIIDQNAKNLQQFEVTNGKLLVDFNTSSNTTTAAVANGNGHIENVNNKNDINILQDVVTPAATQLIDLSIESQDLHNNPLNINNNNSLLTNTTATTTLVTADSHENKDISLL
ncbi:inner centromere protein isoform X1 [Scaptodrosophila lebanonensis]|uniref:Inner centromere protein isoform X1 n=1 Tax=Drosophila lebanonensis TaxID=7225 RepID=A0A6J2TV34_DROLE|nr:inner centromere protein isoform X1 [Scaptodrosophila lebanonensis]